jgi:hypothetical protein
MPLASVSQYNALVNFKNPAASNIPNIQMALNYATAGMECLTKRNLQSQLYNYWYRSDINYSDFFTNIEGYNTDYYVQGNRPQYNESYGPNIVVLNQYPITSICAYRSFSIGFISSTAIIANISISDTLGNMVVNTYDNSGNMSTVNIAFATYKTVGAVVAQVNAIPGWNFNVSAPYLNLPSIFLRSIYATVSASNQEISAAVGYNPFKFTIQGDRKVIFNDVVDESLIQYVAGYIWPVDNSGNTALAIAGNVPLELQQACILAASDILSMIYPDGTTPNPNMLKSEKLGDYEYDKYNQNGKYGWNSNFGSIYEKYQPLIESHILKAL